VESKIGNSLIVQHTGIFERNWEKVFLGGGDIENKPKNWRYRSVGGEAGVFATKGGSRRQQRASD